MSIALEVAGKVHQRQLGAVTKSQNAVIGAVSKGAALREKAPSVPQPVADVTGKVLAPVIRLVGEPTAYVDFAATSTREWLDLQQRFRSQLLGLVTTASAPETAKPRAAKKS
jgi:hypothetical protein